MAISRISTDAIQDNSITTAKTVDSIITADKIADGTINETKLSSTLDLSSVELTVGDILGKDDNPIILSVDNSEIMRLDTNDTITGRNVIPFTNDTYDLGSTTSVWRNIYTGDLHLSNDAKAEGNSVDGTKGNWTIQEGEEHLYIINNKNSKKYRFVLEEIQ